MWGSSRHRWTDTSEEVRHVPSLPTRDRPEVDDAGAAKLGSRQRRLDFQFKDQGKENATLRDASGL